MPAIYAVVIAVIALSLGIERPAAVMTPIRLLSEATLPVMVLVLGMQLAGASMPGLVQSSTPTAVITTTLASSSMPRPAS